LLEDFSQGFVRLPRLGFDEVQLVHDFRDGAVGFGVGGVDVAAGGDIVVVLFQFCVIDDAAEFFFFFPVDEG
jgi:hypothetical protein